MVELELRHTELPLRWEIGKVPQACQDACGGVSAGVPPHGAATAAYATVTVTVAVSIIVRDPRTPSRTRPASTCVGNARALAC